MLICHLYVCFGEVSVKVFAPFFNQVVFLFLSFKSYLYILVKSRLSDMFFANIFSQCGLSSYSLDIVFHRAEVSNFNEVQVINCSFMDPAFVTVLKKSLPNPRSARFSPLLSSRSFIVVCCTLRSMIHFELIFVKGVRFVSRLTFCVCVCVNVQLF